MEISKFNKTINLLKSISYFNNIEYVYTDKLQCVDDVIDNEFDNYILLTHINNSNDLDNDIKLLDNEITNLKNNNTFDYFPKIIVIPSNYDIFNYIDINNDIIVYDIENKLQIYSNKLSNEKFENIFNKSIEIYKKSFDFLIKIYSLDNNIINMLSLYKPSIIINYLPIINDDFYNKSLNSIILFKFNIKYDIIIDLIKNIINENNKTLLNCECIYCCYNITNKTYEVDLKFINKSFINKDSFIYRIKSYIINNYYILKDINIDICNIINGKIY